MLVNLDHAQAIFVILIHNRLNAGGFSGSAVTEKKNIVCLFSLNKGLCIIHKFFLLNLIAHQVVQHYRIHVIDGPELEISIWCIVNTKSLVKTEHTDTVILIKTGYCIKKFLLILCGFQLFT